MEVPLTPEVEAQLKAFAATREITPEALAIELLQRHLAYESWFKAEVQEGLDDLDAGRALPHEQVRESVAKYLSPHEHPVV
jgi:predicted transcriptional regulator